MGEEEGRYCEMNDKKKDYRNIGVGKRSQHRQAPVSELSHNLLKANPIAIVAGEGRVR